MSDPVLPDAMLPEAPFRGADPFRFIDRPIFFERQLETRLVLREIVIYRGVLLYGDSGAGKSSLINAGLIPVALDEGFTPDRIRLKNLKDAEIVVERISLREDGQPPFLRPSLADAKGDADRVVFSIADFKSRLKSFSSDHYPLLIFDQFEEFATLFEEALKPADVPDAKRNQEAILELLVESLRDRQLKVKILFSFREDYLAKLTRLFALSPELQQQYVRLTSPTTDALREIIGGPFKEESLRDHFLRLSPSGTIFSDALINGLEKDFRGRSPSGALNLTEVQLACRELWSSKNPDELYAKENVAGLLRLFLERAVSKLEARKLNEPGVALLSFMVTSFGTRNVISEFDLLSQVRGGGDFSDAQLHEALDLLVKESKIVRRVMLREAPHYEIVSEFFAPWIADRRREREKLRAEKEQQFSERALRMRKLTAFAMSIAVVLLLIALAGAIYAQYKQGLVAQADDKLRALAAREAMLERQTKELIDEADALKTRELEALRKTKLAEAMLHHAEVRLADLRTKTSELVPAESRRRIQALTEEVTNLKTERDDLLAQLQAKETQTKTLQLLIHSLRGGSAGNVGNRAGPTHQSLGGQQRDKQSRRLNMLLGSTVLEVAVGLFFIYLLMSLVCIAATEIIAAVFLLRARSLAAGIWHLLGGDRDLIAPLYAHPLMRSLRSQSGKKPSYIPSRVFALALLDVVAPARPGERGSINYVLDGVAALPNSDLRRALLPVIRGAESVADVNARVEQWYNEAMNRVASSYRTRTGWTVLILAFCLVVTLNLDSLGIANSLSRDEAMRSAVVAAAESYAQNSTPNSRASAAYEANPASSSTPFTEAIPTSTPMESPSTDIGRDLESMVNENQRRLAVMRNEINTLSLPIGWSRQNLPFTTTGWIFKFIGLLLTTLVISLGTPFFFDLLNKIANVRWSIRPRDS